MAQTRLGLAARSQILALKGQEAEGRCTVSSFTSPQSIVSFLTILGKHWIQGMPPSTNSVAPSVRYCAT
ncbi:hypothetical protein [Nostoc sp.]|uniref:hypothetical protein n=1 Tax=Nostoc sp. TaxID=1180 RepID=UPI002FF9B866